MNDAQIPWLGRVINRVLPEKWLQRIDAWAAKPPKPPKPQCPWRSAYGRQCVLTAGHGGTCLTEGPGNRTRSWYGINYNMVEGIPFPK